MVGPSSWLRAILWLLCWGLVYASTNNTSPCSDTTYIQPIAINLALDTVTAACVPSIDQRILLAAVYTRGSISPLPKYAEVTTQLRSKYYQKRHAEPQRHSSLLSKVYSLRDAFFGSRSPAAPNVDEELSPDQIKLGFLEAFERVKNISSTNLGTNITSAVILFPEFFSLEVRELVMEASQEAGIMPFFPASPHTMLGMLEPNILDENITAVKLAAESRKLLIIDYGFLYFDVQTLGRRCKLNYPLDSMGCINLNSRLVNRVNSTNVDIQQQLDQGASHFTLSSAVYQSRFLMKAQSDVESWDEEASLEDLPDKWPLELDDWWVGEKKQAFIYWEDIKSTEAEYISELAEDLDNLLICLQENAARTDQAYSGFDQIIILGNSCDRSIIARAVRQSVGEHARIIGGSSESDILLEVLAGARLAFSFYEVEKDTERYQDAELLDGHEEL